MSSWKKTIIYRSKDSEDWEKAKALLESAGIAYSSFAAEEAPMAGCGAKIDPRRFMNPNQVPSTVYRIEVALDQKEKANSVLLGRVQPVRSYGFSV